MPRLSPSMFSMCIAPTATCVRPRDDGELRRQPERPLAAATERAACRRRSKTVRHADLHEQDEDLVDAEVDIPALQRPSGQSEETA
jgi:hypothetical protein